MQLIQDLIGKTANSEELFATLIKYFSFRSTEEILLDLSNENVTRFYIGECKFVANWTGVEDQFTII